MPMSGLAVNVPGVSSCNCTSQPPKASATATRQEKPISSPHAAPSLVFEPHESSAGEFDNSGQPWQGRSRTNEDGGPPVRPAPVRTACGLLLLTGAGSLGRPEGNPSPHGLLLNGRRGTPELLRDLAGRGSRFRERLQGLQLTGAPGSAIVRGTFRHYSILQKTPNCRVGVESYTLLRKKARQHRRCAVKRHVVGSGQLVEGSQRFGSSLVVFGAVSPEYSRSRRRLSPVMARGAVTFATLQPAESGRRGRECSGKGTRACLLLHLVASNVDKPRLGASGAAGERAARTTAVAEWRQFELLPGADP